MRFGRDVSSTTRQHNHRKSMNRHSDNRVFSATADKSRVENSRKVPMRGGYRL